MSCLDLGTQLFFASRLSYLIVILALAAIYLVPLVGDRRLDVLTKLLDVVPEISVVRRWGCNTIIVLK